MMIGYQLQIIIWYYWIRIFNNKNQYEILKEQIFSINIRTYLFQRSIINWVFIIFKEYPKFSKKSSKNLIYPYKKSRKNLIYPYMKKWFEEKRNKRFGFNFISILIFNFITVNFSE